MSETLVKPSYILEIEDLGFAYSEDAQFDISVLSKDKRVQSREFGSAPFWAPKEEMRRYAIQMTHSPFPPIIVTRDGWLVDGNTRVGARDIRKEKFSPAIVLEVEYGKMKPIEQEKVYGLAVTINSQNGRNLTTKERRASIALLIDLGWNNTQIEKRIGVRVHEINKMRRVITARGRLEKLGVTVNGNLSQAAVAVLGDEKVLLLNDDPYKAIAALATDAGLNSKEVRDIAYEALALGSDDEKMKRVAAVRGEFKEQIEAVKFEHAAKPPLARQLRQHLGFVNKYEGNVSALKESNPAYAEEHATYVTTAIKVLSQLLEEIQA